MKSLHEELREIRLEKGITIEEVHDLTKINLDFLVKIEKGDYSIVPQPFLRAFLREFAEVLEVDPGRVMMKYDNKINYIREPEISEPKPDNEASEEKTAKTETTPEEPDQSGETQPQDMKEHEPIVQSPENESVATDENEQPSDAITQPSLFDRSTTSSGEPSDAITQPSLFGRLTTSSGEPETPIQQPSPEVQSGEAASTQSNVPVERQRLHIDAPDKSHAVFIIIAVVLIITAALVIFWLSP